MLEYDKIKLEAGLLILESRGTTQEAAALLIKNGYKLEVFDMVETVFQAILKSLPVADPFCFCQGNEVLKQLLGMRK